MGMYGKVGLALVVWACGCGVLAEVRPEDAARVYIYGTGMGRARLSGVLIAKTNGYGYVLTAAHGYPPTGRTSVRAIYVWLAQGGVYEAQAVAVDRAADLSLLKIAEPPDDPFPLAQETPAPGELVYWGGFEQFRGGFIARQGAVAGLSGERLLIREGGAVPGQSGGPVLNAQKEVVGITVATDGRRVIAVGLPGIRAFLKQPMYTFRDF